MAYGLRFLGEWKDQFGGISRFEISQRNYFGNAEVMVMQGDPLSFEQAVRDNKFKASVGSGLTLKVEATYDGQYVSLYTKDKQKFKGKFYKNDQLVWTGYLNSEVYSERYTCKCGYPVTLQFNDGFTVMERIPFLQSNGKRYTGLKTAWEMLWIILNKTGIDFKYVYLALDVYEKHMNVNSSPFHQMKVNCANYYDEKGDAMNCRAVLDEIVKTQRAYCIQNEACFYITSVSLLAKETYVRRRYETENSSQVLQNVNATIEVPNEVDWYGTDQVVDVLPGYNKVSLKYSPYGEKEVIENCDLSESELWNGEYSWEDVGNFFQLQDVDTISGWQMKNGTSFGGTKEEEVDDDEVYFKLPFETTDNEVVLLENNADSISLTGVSRQGFKVSFQLYVATKSNEFDQDEDAKYVRQLGGRFVIDVAGKRPESILDDPWQWSENAFQQRFGVSSDASTIADQWHTIDKIVPGNCPFGYLKLRFLKRFTADKGINQVIDPGTIKHIRIKDITITPVQVEYYTAQSGRIGISHSETDFSDIEFVAEMDDDWKNEAPDIEMLHGDSKENNCTDRGGLHLLDNNYTGEWKTEDDSEYYDISELILRGFESNYRDSLRQLKGTIQTDNLFNGNGITTNGVFNFQSIMICPESTLEGKRLMCMGGSYNDKRQTFKGTWLEVLPDDLTINN